MDIDQSVIYAWREAFAVSDRLAELDEEARCAELDSLRQMRPAVHGHVIDLLLSYGIDMSESPFGDSSML